MINWLYGLKKKTKVKDVFKFSQLGDRRVLVPLSEMVKLKKIQHERK